MKYILVTGGGVAKDIITSSTCALLKACDLRVIPIKIDTYIRQNTNVQPSRLSREVFVTDDGCEVDQDLGHLERFLDISLTGANHITTGKIYQHVINKERAGDYLGKTVRTVPHITDYIQEWIKKTANRPTTSADVCVIELGGSADDTSARVFAEALRQLASDHPCEDFCCLHVEYVPRMKASGEFKTKDLQSHVHELRGSIMCPNMIITRSESAITDSVREKIAKSCGVRVDKVINLPDFKTIYQVPVELERRGLINGLASCLKLDIQPNETIKRWFNLSQALTNEKPNQQVVIALVGKYPAPRDCYTSVIEAVEHACYSQGLKLSLCYIDSCQLLQEDTDPQKYAHAWQDLKSSHGLIVPSAFGYEGVEGKIAAINWARTNKMPYLGICLGFQTAAIEYARNVLGLKDANSAEFAKEAPTTNPIVIDMLESEDSNEKIGATMRLGSHSTRFVTDKSIVRKLYGDAEAVNERHRYRYEINPVYVDKLEEAGLRFVGKNDDGCRMEILELDESVHPYFVAVQYHPEYLTRPFKPSPPYLGLVMASKLRSDQN